MERSDVERPFYTADLAVDDVETWTPILEVQFGDEKIQLSHFNVLVRLFENVEANHVELRHENSLKGLRMAQDIIDLMVKYDYSFRWDKRVDEQTTNWLVAIESAHLDDEIDELEGLADES